MADSILYAANAGYLEDLVRRYLDDPQSVDASWRVYFEGPGRDLIEGSAPRVGPSFTPSSIFAPAGAEAPAGSSMPDAATMKSQGRISQLINAYRVRGHLHATLDPLGFMPKPYHSELEPAYWGFKESDYDRVFSTATLNGPQEMTLRDLLAWLRETYARTIGCEFMHIHDVRIKSWLQAKFERTKNHCYDLDHGTQLYLYERLKAAEGFESFLGLKYRGSKRFSLEGGESLIPLCALIIEEVAKRGVLEVVLGMAHRGRLNMLANIMGKREREIFIEFDDTAPEEMIGCGDVKYHMGYSADTLTRHGDKVHLSLTFNPSHLEAINPVVEGKVRAKQDRHGDVARKLILPLLIHGDAAFAGQGIVPETINMSGLEAYYTGGTIHIIVNNQIGFTTEPRDSRSSPYSSDVAKLAQIPIMHVNGEDPEAVAHVAKIAAEFRQTFQRDVVIDMYCFRRYGHNEGDEPAFTQPLMYDKIGAHPPVSEVYEKQLIKRGNLTAAEIADINKRHSEALEHEFEQAREHPNGTGVDAMRGLWSNYVGGWDKDTPRVDTSIDDALFEQIVKGLTTIPDDFDPHPKIKRVVDRRRKALDPAETIDWGLGESMAYGSLVLAGAPVRISGQDAIRGTFSHRHAGLFDRNTGDRYFPLANMHPNQGRFEVYNSHLSEAAVLGFDYGYALDSPDALVVWEAQFGDFANGAQVIIDQFISASEDKWKRLSGIVMLLPHGFEGQGPEHSSARLERWLALCAEDNMQVVNLTTPAQIFHALRRQVVRPWRKPLIVMSPKSLLRHKRAVSMRADFTQHGFKRVIAEQQLDDVSAVDRAVLCTGKVYYDLLERREATEDATTAIIRVEQLYPFPEAEIQAALDALPGLKEVVWCQEEPENMGARNYLHPLFTEMFNSGPPVYWVAREASASPATGSPKAHHMEQEALMDRAFSRALKIKRPGQS